MEDNNDDSVSESGSEKGLNAIALLFKVKNYNEGIGEYNFSNLNSNDRDNAAFDAWMRIKEEMDRFLEQNSPKRTTKSTTAIEDYEAAVKNLADRNDKLEFPN